MTKPRPDDESTPALIGLGVFLTVAPVPVVIAALQPTGQRILAETGTGTDALVWSALGVAIVGAFLLSAGLLRLARHLVHLSESGPSTDTPRR